MLACPLAPARRRAGSLHPAPASAHHTACSTLHLCLTWTPQPLTLLSIGVSWHWGERPVT